MCSDLFTALISVTVAKNVTLVSEPALCFCIGLLLSDLWGDYKGNWKFDSDLLKGKRLHLK